MCLHSRIPRRRALQVILAGLAATLASSRAAQAQGPYNGPFVDAHSHLKAGQAPPIHDLIRVYDDAGVTGAILFGEPWWLATEARDAYPDRVVPFLAEGYANALHPDSSYVNPAGLTQLFQAQVVRGLGEIILRHSPYQLSALHGYASAPANNVPADDARLIEAYRVAGDYGVAVNIHQEWTSAAELARALDAAADTTFVWAHAGHGPAGVLGGMLARHPNLMADLSARSPWLGPGTVLLHADGSLAPEWSRVLHEYPDRIVVGLDLFVPEHYAPSYVGQMVRYYRGLLGQLDPAVASLIGHQNAERIAPFSS